MKMFPGTLWHGTSGHLLPMIEEYGLGGRNVMADWRVMELLQRTFPLLNFDGSNYQDPDYMELLPARAAAEGGAVGMNFVYGDIYAVGGYEKAASYADYAPELISFVRIVLAAADRRGINSVSKMMDDYPEIQEFLRLEAKPIVLKLPPIPMDKLRSEDGDEASFLVEPNDEIIDEILSQLAFRVDAVIPFGEIEVLDARGH